MSRWKWDKPVASGPKEKVTTNFNAINQRPKEAPRLSANGSPDIPAMRQMVKDLMIKYRIGKWTAK